MPRSNATMNSEAESTYRGLIIGLAGLLLLQIVSATVWHKWLRHESSLPAGDFSAVVPQMQEYLRQRRYDDAVQAGLASLKTVPSDDVVLQQIAVVYLRRAQLEGEPDRWTQQAADYAEKALSVHPRDQVNVYSSGRVFEIAGDFSSANRCAYYGRSAAILQERLELLDGTRNTVDGGPAPPASLRQENEYLLARVKMKSKKNGCP